MESAGGRDDFEIVLRCDDDDQSLNTYLHWFNEEDFPMVRLIVGKRMRGYPDIHVFMDECAKSSKAKWIMQFNDDCIIQGPWLEDLEKVTQQNIIVQPQYHRLGGSTYERDSCCPFVTLPNGYWSELGIEGMPFPADTGSIRPLMEKGWRVHYMKGVSVHHIRDNNETLEEHRKL